jgi:hypothetical protein
MSAIETADTVLHRPTGEEWLVAGVDGDRLYWCGWPPGRANLADCELVQKATDEDRSKLRAKLAQLDADDPRQRFGTPEQPK